MPKSKVKLILNPNSDFGRAGRSAADLRPIVEEFGGADWSGTVYPTHATELSQQAAEQGYEIVIAVGGDGTIHEVINGLMRVPEQQRPRLGIVPVGSGNDFSYNAGVERRPEIAMRRIFNGTVKKIDVARITTNRGRHEYWNNTLGIGFDATVNIRSRRMVMVRGFFAYFIPVLQTIILNHEAPRMRITANGEHWEDELMMVTLCNGAREGGGFLVAPNARVDDGRLDYVSICRVSRPMMFRLLPEVMRGTHGRFPQVRMGQFQRLSLESEWPLRIHADGEIFAGFGTDVTSLSVEIIPQAIELIV